VVVDSYEETLVLVPVLISKNRLRSESDFGTGTGFSVFQRKGTNPELGSWFFRDWNWIQVLQNSAPHPTFTPVLVLVLKIELGSSPILDNVNLAAG